MCAAVGVLLMTIEPWAANRNIYFIVDVTLKSAAVGVLLMSMEPFSATRKAINYCGSDTHLCCRWCAAYVHRAMGCDQKSFTLFRMSHSCVLPLVCC